MNFHQLSTKLERRLNEILDSANVIEEQHIKDAARVLKKFAELDISESKIKPFLKNVLLYFVLLNSYLKQFEEMNPHQEYTIRMALDIFLDVVDSTEIHQKIIRQFVRIIDAMLESDAPNGNVKECIRVYSYLLDRVPEDCIQQLAVKHKTYPNLNNIIKNTCDIATQAIIVELVLKLNKYGKCTPISETFREFLSIAEITSCDGIFIYQNIRMILDHLNEHSDNIFSINCVTIELDSARVLEFKGAENTNDIWLDFNLLQEKLSFFCDKSFTCLINDLKFRSATWEVLSFSVKDMLRITFEYDKLSKNLIILCKIKTSSFALFQEMRFVRIMNLKIVISKYSERFGKLIKDVLPKLFKDKFSFESLNISLEQNDSSVTPDIEILNNSDDSSPVIEHFEKPRKKISTTNEDYLPVMGTSANMSEGSIITISDDENEQEQLTPSAESVVDTSKSQKISASPFVRNYYDFYTDITKFRDLEARNSTLKKGNKKIGTLNTKGESPSNNKTVSDNKSIMSNNESESRSSHVAASSIHVENVDVSINGDNDNNVAEEPSNTRESPSNKKTVSDNKSIMSNNESESRSSHVAASSIHVENVDVSINGDNDNNVPEEPSNTRLSTLRKDAVQLFNKSTSPISFTESVFLKSQSVKSPEIRERSSSSTTNVKTSSPEIRERSPSRTTNVKISSPEIRERSPSRTTNVKISSPEIRERSLSTTTNVKISSPKIRERSSSNVKISSFNKKFEGTKISTIKNDASKIKISSSLLSPVLSSTKIVKKPEEKNIGAINIMEENIIDDSFREENMRLSIVKVCSWLNQVTTPSPLHENEKLDDIQIITSPEITQQPLQTALTQISQRSSDLPPEKRLEILMPGDVEDEVPLLNNGSENQNCTTVEDLVHLLESQEVTTGKEVGNAVEQTIISSKTGNASVDSEMVPLIVLKKKRQMENQNENLEPISQNLTEFDSNNNNVREKRIISEDEDKSVHQDGHDVESEDKQKSIPQTRHDVESDFNNKDKVESVVQVVDEPIEKTENIVDKFDELIATSNNLNYTSLHSHEDSLKENLHVSIQSSGSTKSSKRKLYNPDDLTYLSKTITQEYLNSKEPSARNFFGSSASKFNSKDKTNNISKNSFQRKKVLDSENTRSKSKKGKNKNNEHTEVGNMKIKKNSKSTSKKENRKILDDSTFNEPEVIELRSHTRKPTKTKVKTPRKGRKKSTKPSKASLELTKSDIYRNDTKNKTHLNGTFTKVFNSLKEKIREHEKESKERRRKLGLKRKSSSSSIDCMESFGVAVSSSLKKAKMETDSKHMEVEHHNDQVEVKPMKKINVISNILLQPAPNQNCQSLEPSVGCCCENLLKVSSEFFLESMMHVKRCKPHLINSDRYKPTMNSLRDFFKEL